MVGQALVEQQEIGLPVEGNFSLPGEGQLACFAQLLDTWVDGRRIDAVRPFAHQAHDRGAVGGVADAGGRQRTVQTDFHTTDIVQQTLIDQRLGEGRSGAHRADGVGAGRADADFE